jgi:hypothetical protein
MPDFNMPVCFVVFLALARGFPALRWCIGRPR